MGASPLIFPRLFAAGASAEKIQLAAFLGTTAFVVMVYATAGLLVTRHRPRNSVGWLMLAGGPALGAVFVGYVVGVSLAQADPGTSRWAVLLAVVLFGPALYLLAPALASVFPTGRPLPGWWSAAVWASAAMIIVGAVIAAFTPGPLEDGIPLTNPIGINILPAGLRQVANAITGIALVGGVLTAVASLVVRYAGSSSETRHQLKWFVSAGVVVAIVFPLSFVIGDLWTAVIALLALGLVPASVVVAILRYRLYDIDLIINRTLVYAGVTVILAAAFGGAHLLAQGVVHWATGARSELVTAALAVGAALAFAPLRRWIRPFVDRVLPARAELTLFFTDIVESTRLAVELGDDRWRTMLDRYRIVVRRELTRHGGHEVDTAGDGFFATFVRPAAGLRCAWAISAATDGLGLTTRSGLHVGVCEMRGEKPSGVAVHAAARIMAAAGAGEILVSDAVREALGMASGPLEVTLRDHGPRDLKGVPGEWRLYRVEPTAEMPP